MLTAADMLSKRPRQRNPYARRARIVPGVVRESQAGRVSRIVAEEHAGVQRKDRDLDAGAHQLIQDPTSSVPVSGRVDRRDEVPGSSSQFLCCRRQSASSSRPPCGRPQDERHCTSRSGRGRKAELEARPTCGPIVAGDGNRAPTCLDENGAGNGDNQEASGAV